jgi:hypothetical protein
MRQFNTALERSKSGLNSAPKELRFLVGSGFALWSSDAARC